MFFYHFKVHLFDYLANSSIHGLRFLVDRRLSLFERVLWLIVMLITCWYLVILGRSTLISFRTEAYAFVVDTAYLDWNTSFPAITICESNDIIYGYHFVQELNNHREDGFKFDPILMRKMIFYYVGDFQYPEERQYYQMDLRNISLQYRANCTSLLWKCSWRNKIFDCCTTFLPLETEHGPCYSANSANTRIIKNNQLDMTMNRHLGLGALTIEVSRNVKVYIDSAEEVPYHSTENRHEKLIRRGYNSRFLFTTEEVMNQPGIRDIAFMSRQCAFQDEIQLKMYPSYSYSGCIVNCRFKAHLKFCKCSHHLMPGIIKDREQMCNLSSLSCLYDMNDKIESEMNKCSCVNSCTKNEYDVIYYEEMRNDEYPREISKITFEMAFLPSLRLHRNVVRSYLDLVVSAGGIVGLLVGASLLSFVEFFVYFCIRIFNRDKKMNKSTKMDITGYRKRVLFKDIDFYYI